MPITSELANRYDVQSVSRAAQLLNLVANEGAGGLGVTEIAGYLHVAKSTALYLARTLNAAGLLRAVEPGPRYVLGVSLLRWGDLVGQQTTIAALALPTLRDLSSTTAMTARLAMNENGYPVMFDRVDGVGTIRFHAPLGQREEPHTSAAGKAILAQLDEVDIRAMYDGVDMPVRTPNTITNVSDLLEDLSRVLRDGYAFDNEEGAEGIFCVGAAFFDNRGKCAGALSVTGLKEDRSLRDMHRLGEVVMGHADQVTAILDDSLN
jgi:IclR family transcriptional regulator, acetate operon repressor